MKHNIPFNSVHLTGRESSYLEQVLRSGQLSGNGPFSKKCHQFFEENYEVKRALLTSSCTDALEMCALLCELGPGDEVILPSYTFVSTANAFLLRGVTLRFADSESDYPNICLAEIERLLTPATKAIVVVHYGGVACQMDRICEMARKRGIFVIEDAAQGIDSYYKGRPLGSIGDLGTFSFHQTKNVVAGEAGLLAINSKQFLETAEIVWEKGTDRSKFVRGEVDRYGWVRLGSSFLASELSAAVLYAQLEAVSEIQARRIEIWNEYFKALKPLSERGYFQILEPHEDATNNAHLFAIVGNDGEQAEEFLDFAQERGIGACSHYGPLHQSAFFADRYEGPALPNSVRFASCLVRLPLFFELTSSQQEAVIETVTSFPWKRPAPAG